LCIHQQYVSGYTGWYTADPSLAIELVVFVMFVAVAVAVADDFVDMQLVRKSFVEVAVVVAAIVPAGFGRSDETYS
jgi:hypothetical protein